MPQILTPHLELPDHSGEPFSLQQAVGQHAATALYSFRGYW